MNTLKETEGFISSDSVKDHLCSTFYFILTLGLAKFLLLQPSLSIFGGKIKAKTRLSATSGRGKY